MTKKTKKKLKPDSSKKKKRSENKKVQPEARDLDKVKKIKIRVIGIGGGGGNIVSEIAAKISKAGFVVANTDSKSLKSCSKKVIKFQFGQSLTHGLGTGMNPELAKTAAKKEKEKIKKLCQGWDLCILVACLGGGTGSGAVTTFAKISKDLGNLTYGIFTLPFKFEGEKKIGIAIDALKEVKSKLNAITIIPNEKVFQIIDKDTPLKQALSNINQFLSESLGGLIETIYQPGLINIDFADFKTILEERGKLAYLNTVELHREEGTIKDVVAKALKSPLYPYTIRGVKGVLFNIVGEKKLSLADVGQISKTISELVSPKAKIIFGVSQDKKYANTVKVILLATGCSTRILSPTSKKGEKKKEIKKAQNKSKEKQILKSEKKKDSSAASHKDKSKVKTKNSTQTFQKNKDKKKIKKKAKTSLKDKPLKAKIKKSKNSFDKDEEKIRKNGLQIKKEVEEAEKEIVEKEKAWEKPAFLRKKTN